ncbi:MAG: hypothetical protein CO108_21530 [Deltaproteobacteria bacterium CG_4_9_14_3_um_filter_63_12]|nr:MAG: hypothetical protein CO108_21530 [Deltaproteobacteria bacterium CG_4_9_14_3_um_filter_63_12]
MSAQAEPLFKAFLDHEAEPIRKLLDAAERCLWRSGYGDMSIRDVAEEAGVSKSLLHYHFKSKEHLLIEVQIGVYNRIAVSVATAVGNIEPGREALLRAYDALFGALKSTRELPVLAELWARSLTNPQLKAHAARLRQHLGELIIQTMESILGPETRNLPVTLPIAADLLLGVLAGLGLQAGIEDDGRRVEEAVAGLRRLLALSLGLFAPATTNPAQPPLT